MKSKTFFSDYTKTQFKKQLWIMGLIAFVLVLVLPASLLIELGNLEHARYTWFQRQNQFQRFMVCSEGLILVVMISGFLTALYQFRYLHSRKMIDFYHSLPIRKEKIYQMHVMSAYLDFVIPYTVMVLLCLVLGTIRGVMTSEAFLIYGFMWLFHQLTFLMIYGVTAVAMLLTGRGFVGGMGTSVLLLLPLTIAGLLDAFSVEFFSTYIGYYNGEEWLSKLSPGYSVFAARNIFLTNLNNQIIFSGELIIQVAIIVGFMAAFLGIGYFLMKKRPSEAAGNSMAFPIPARVIHVILCIIGALYVGFFIYSMTNYNSIAWLLGGTAFGGIVLYILIQFIYTVDFRKVLRYKWQLVLVEIISVGAAAMFCFDWIGYDSYIPEQENLYSVAISIPDGYQYESYYMDEKYVDAEEYRLENMNLMVTDEIYKMLEETVEENAAYSGESAIEYNGSSVVQVRYKLKNGRERNREYRMELDHYRDLFVELYGQAEFKNIMMPMYGLFEADGSYELSLKFENESRTLFGDDKEKSAEFVRVLKHEFEKMDGDTIVNEIPLAEVNVYSKDMDRGYDLYIYPSNTEVITYLADSGYKLESSLTIENILKIEIEDARKLNEQKEYEIYTEDAYTGAMVTREGATESKQIVAEIDIQPVYTTYTEPEDIAQIIPALVQDFYNHQWYNTCSGLYATVTYIGKDGYQVQMYCELLEDKLPEFLKAE